MITNPIDNLDMMFGKLCSSPGCSFVGKTIPCYPNDGLPTYGVTFVVRFD